ncbi:MAG: hypothetical protein AAF497_22845, partial [Planctomycetota bacterium]
AELILEATRIAWRSYRFPRYVEENFSDPDPSSVTVRFKKLEKDARNAILIKALQSDAPDTNRIGLRVCVESRKEIQSDASWGPVLEELQSQSKVSRPYPGETALLSGEYERSAPTASVWKLVYASCVPDKDRCQSELTTIDSDQSQDWVIRTMFNVVRERNLTIPREMQLKWIAQHLAKLSYGYLDSGNQRSIDPIQLGVLGKLDRTQLFSQQQQLEINQLALPLLREAEQAHKAAKDNAPRMKQYVAIGRIKVLTWLVENYGLTGDAQKKAVDLLTQRLRHLLKIRPTASQLDNYSELDTPDEIAATLVLLTGKFPQLLIENEDDSFQPVQRDPYRYSGRPSVAISRWWPVEWVKTLRQNDSSRSALMNARMGSRGVTPGRSSRDNEAVKPALLVAMFDNEELAQVAAGLLGNNSLATAYRKHPAFRDLVNRMLNDAADEHALAACFKLWKGDKVEEEATNFVANAIQEGSTAQLRFAIGELLEDESMIEEDRKARADGAFDKLSQSKKLNYTDLRNAKQLFPHASKQLSEYAMAFVLHYISDPAFQREQQRIRPASRSGSTVLTYVLSMIESSHLDQEFIKQLKDNPAVSGTDAKGLETFLKKL